MKIHPLYAGVLALFAVGASPAFGADSPRAEVVFDHPENFTDVKDKFPPTDQGRDAILKELADTVVAEAGHIVPQGCKLTITFTDIELAGKFEPWRGPRFDDVRIVRDIYPPHFKFSYTLADASGRVLLQGREDLLDVSFQSRLVLDRQDPLCYEKDILKDWMRSHLRGVRAPAAAARS